MINRSLVRARAYYDKPSTDEVELEVSKKEIVGLKMNSAILIVHYFINFTDFMFSSKANCI